MKTKAKDKNVALLLAFLFSYFTFIYTYKEDKDVFWLLFFVNLLTCWTIVGPLVVWMYVIICIIEREPKFYEDYGKV